ncbi:MAG TPA: hypothetical protein VK625_16845 [Flavitalea sp.]|nr:hypothetical protein [Flavitalea sp.]
MNDIEVEWVGSAEITDFCLPFDLGLYSFSKSSPTMIESQLMRSSLWAGSNNISRAFAFKEETRFTSQSQKGGALTVRSHRNTRHRRLSHDTCWEKLLLFNYWSVVIAVNTVLYLGKCGIVRSIFLHIRRNISINFHQIIMKDQI